MSRPFKLRYVNELVGTLVLLTIVMVLAVIVLVAREQDWFIGNYRLYAVVTHDTLDSITAGSQVLVLGQDAGEVESIDYSEAGDEIIIALKVKETFRNYIFDDSTLQVRRKLAGAGETYLEIVRGSVSRRIAQPGDRLEVVGEAAPVDELRRVVEMMGDIRDSFSQAGHDFEGAMSTFESSMGNFDVKITDLGGSVDSAVVDLKDSNQQLQNVLGTLEQTAPEFDRLVRNAGDVVDKSRDVIEVLRSETQELPGTVDDFREGIGGAQTVIDAMRNHPLLRKHVDQPDADKIIEPAQVGRGVTWR